MDIKKQYHDALYFAVAKINKQTTFSITPIQKSIIEKMIHYEKKYPKITFKNVTIAEHLFSTEITIKNGIEDLYRKGYLESVTGFHTNFGSAAKSRVITINWSKLQEVLDLIPTKEKTKEVIPNIVSKELKVKTKAITPIKEEVVVEEVIEEPIQVVIPKPIVVKKQIINQEDERTLKEIMEDKFKRNFKFPLNSQQREMHVNEFNLLTKNKFQEKMSFPEISELVKTINNKDFDLFWNTIQELKNKIIKNKLETV